MAENRSDPAIVAAGRSNSLGDSVLIILFRSLLHPMPMPTVKISTYRMHIVPLSHVPPNFSMSMSPLQPAMQPAMKKSSTMTVPFISLSFLHGHYLP